MALNSEDPNGMPSGRESSHYRNSIVTATYLMPQVRSSYCLFPVQNFSPIAIDYFSTVEMNRKKKKKFLLLNAHEFVKKIHHSSSDLTANNNC